MGDLLFSSKSYAWLRIANWASIWAQHLHTHNDDKSNNFSEGSSKSNQCFVIHVFCLAAVARNTNSRECIPESDF